VFDGAGASWTYTMTDGAGVDNIATFTQTEILVGDVASVSAGSVLGPIPATDSNNDGDADRQGTGSFTL